MSLIKEPLIHFLALGGLIFVIYAGLQNNAPDNEINIDIGTVQYLKNNYEKIWNKAPNEEALETLISEYALDEIYFRQAKTLGIDQQDPLIRKRLRQKMEFISESIRATISPSEEALLTFYQKESQRYEAPAKLNFKQRFYNAKYSKNKLVAAIAKNNYPPSDTNLLDSEYSDIRVAEVNKLFGQTFSQALLKAEPDRTTHLIQSGLGWHIVTQLSITSASVMPFSEVRDQVLRDWQYQQQAQFKQTMNTSLLAQYKISVETSE